ncbi:NAD(P)H-dependent oxidoreductase [Fulvivirga ligni]|uniref:NAD(P)H-dependent oxidoreductase n=1 Tax=Fulvivirga ligni TaxID=2904246 RepID=UPI001F39007B|nr:NAD(P)H-dependent oxidoreductase [Fulvivirga ligni]UII20613.1 NAD(P)H-dependent oxidoreductase [Fulvivirga ligni]
MSLYDNLHWRYATKKMNGTAVPEEKVEKILEAIRMAPTSMGLQPFQVIVITDHELKKEILPLAFNQQQMVDSSHLLVFAAWDQVTEARAKAFIELNMKVRNVTEESLATVAGYLENLVKAGAESNFNWTSRQAYLAMGFGLVAAAEEKVDATPMEGFNNAGLDELLGLDKIGLKSVTLMPLGYRDEENDWLASLPKVRKPAEELFIKK